MKLGVISDPHGNSFGLAAALEALEQADVDRVICAGDIVGYYPFVNETIDTLRDRGVDCIAGNHDLYLRRDLATTPERWKAYHLDYVDETISPEHRSWLAALPRELDLMLDGSHVHVCHGSPWSAEEYVYPNTVDEPRFMNVAADVVIMGHTHIPLVRRVDSKRGGVLLFNPGSCGQPRDYVPLASYGTYDTDRREARVSRVAYDIDTVRERCEALGFSPAVRDILTRTR
jgi:putative phosphoesterase